MSISKSIPNGFSGYPSTPWNTGIKAKKGQFQINQKKQSRNFTVENKR